MIGGCFGMGTRRTGSIKDHKNERPCFACVLQAFSSSLLYLDYITIYNLFPSTRMFECQSRDLEIVAAAKSPRARRSWRARLWCGVAVCAFRLLFLFFCMHWAGPSDARGIVSTAPPPPLCMITGPISTATASPKSRGHVSSSIDRSIHPSSHRSIDRPHFRHTAERWGARRPAQAAAARAFGR